MRSVSAAGHWGIFARQDTKRLVCNLHNDTFHFSLGVCTTVLELLTLSSLTAPFNASSPWVTLLLFLLQFWPFFLFSQNCPGTLQQGLLHLAWLHCDPEQGSNTGQNHRIPYSLLRGEANTAAEGDCSQMSSNAHFVQQLRKETNGWVSTW